MKLDSEFYRLPLAFDAKKMSEEINIFKTSDWMPHPTGFKGNGSIPLISVNGEANDEFKGSMLTTPFLKKCPYIQQVIASFDEVFGRSRLMKLSGGSEVPEHSDLNYHWYSNVRIHIPIITFPEVTFYCGNKNVHMAAGEAWIFDSWQMHSVINPTTVDRVHLVIDTAGSSKFWEMVKHSDRPQDNVNSNTSPKFLSNSPTNTISIKTEKYNEPVIMSPGEMDALCIDLIDDASNNKNNAPDTLNTYVNILNIFRHDWRATWSLCGPEETEAIKYRSIIQTATNSINNLKNISLGSNGANAKQVFWHRILHTCMNITNEKKARAITQTLNEKKDGKKNKVGRNSPCPCGSGKKYKHCHG